jgi:hypothetical protein
MTLESPGGARIRHGLVNGEILPQQGQRAPNPTLGLACWLRWDGPAAFEVRLMRPIFQMGSGHD